MGLRGWGLGLRVDVGFFVLKVWGLGFRVWDLGLTLGVLLLRFTAEVATASTQNCRYDPGISPSPGLRL